MADSDGAINYWHAASFTSHGLMGAPGLASDDTLCTKSFSLISLSLSFWWQIYQKSLAVAARNGLSLKSWASETESH